MSFKLEKLLVVRKNREQQAAGRVSEARQSLNLAKQALAKAKSAYADYQQSRQTQMADLKQRYLGKALNMVELEHWNDSLLWLDERLEDHSKAIETQEAVISERKVVLRQAKHEHAKLHRALQKVETQKDQFQQEFQKITERKAELEIEESFRFANAF